MKKPSLIFFPLILVALLYLPFLHNVFISDDIGGIVESMPRWTWLEAIGWPRVIHLGVTVQYWIYHLFGLIPWPFRLINILFHMGNVVLVCLVVKKLATRRIAFIASVFFAIHPLATEAVTWISGGVYVQYTFFFLLSFYLYLSRGAGIVVPQALSVCCFLLALLVSEKAVTLSVLFPLYEWFFGNFKANWKRLIPYVIISIGFMLFYITRIEVRLINLEAENYQQLTGLHNPLVQIPIAISSYLELFVWPKNLTFYHSSFWYGVLEFGIRIVVTAGFFVLALWSLVRKRSFGFWLWWFVASLAVTLVPMKVAWIVAERYAYCGLIGPCVVVGMAFTIVLSYKKWNTFIFCIGAACTIALCTRTIVRNNDWRTADSFWVATVNVSPNDPHSWNNMGDVYSRRGEHEKSILAFTRAIELKPNYAAAYFNIGQTYIAMKKYKEAIPFFEKALVIDPNLWQAYQNLGFIATAKFEYQKAIEYFNKALRINPADATLLENIRTIRSTIGH
jgi:tetratricopeptide (TPR) repeat protein